MKIVLVIDQFDKLNNGTTATAQRYAEALRIRGHTVTVLASGIVEKDKISVAEMRIPIFQPLIEKQGFCFARPNDEAYFQAFSSADIIHFYLPTQFCRRGEEIARQMRIPTVASFHLQPENITYSLGLGKSRRANDAFYRYFYHSFYSRFRYIHCPSEMIAGQLHRHGYDAQCRVISNGVSEQFRPQAVSRPLPLQNKFIVLVIGRLSAEKRQDIVIKAVRSSKYADRIQLVFAGRGPKERKYKRLGKGLPNAPLFGFYSQEELLGLINACDLYIHASDAEIEGISCMEAMACGLVPVISDSELSATKLFALHPNSLFCAGDARSLAERIDYWIEHPQERQETGWLYAQRANQMRVSRCAAEMEVLYKDVIADYWSNGYKKPEESSLRRMTHPDSAKVSVAYSQITPIKQTLFSAFTNLLALLLYIIDTVCFGLKVRGKEAFKKVKGGAVTVMNHIHPMDCTMVKLAVFPRRIYFTSLRRNLELPFVGWLIKLCGALPLPLDMKEMVWFQKQLKHGIHRGDLVHYYPEGLLIRHHEELRDFHTGAFFTAVYSGCPVIPMVITYLYPRGLWRLAGGKRRMLLSIGDPQYPNGALSHKEAVQELSERTREAMRQMKEEPASAEELSLSLVVRAACVLFLAVQVLQILGVS
ncbi:MAG: glycosyltransferase [Candidatus Pelethousia sp.]|jgi:1,2-diacylglycerol 3-alpha-glucosyltransferase|nr:glycosyltransferase [Candidatus Pelethousia sp.]